MALIRRHPADARPMVAPHTLGLFVPGGSWLHRAPAASKLIALALLGLGLTLAPAGWAWSLGSASLAALVGVAAAIRLPLGRAARDARGVVLLMATVGGYQWWRAGWEVTVGVTSTLLALLLAGLIATMTTPLAEIVDVVLRIARPLRRFGLDPQWVGLAVALTLRGIPTLVEVFTEASVAARARGLERHPRALLVPSVVRTVARARRTGEALAARGVLD